MTGITTIVHFSLPKENMNELLTTWRKTRDIMPKQPGALDGVMHLTVDGDSPFQFVNVARWESAEALENARKVAAKERLNGGVDVMEEMRRLGATISQNNYIEEAKY
ncbi:antibiotic biosynthesis monooxygenase [Variovorax sp. GT1P44]|uniref:antibiotic biosynthesis monooxygenase n=1 Tax=Variovorax sp. GT1P44 TaxID=3443742 RepID=UPI003F46C0AE